MEPTQYLFVLIVPLFLGLYYWRYSSKLKKAGGWQEILQRVAQAKWGLAPGEVAPEEWAGQLYIGPLVPGSEPSTGEKIGAFISNTTYRGRNLALTITSMNRLVIAAEPLEDDKGKFDVSMGDTGYRPWAVFLPHERPRLVEPHVAFGAHPKLKKELENGPEHFSTKGHRYKMQLAVLQTARGPIAMWMDPDAIPRVHAWCSGA